MFMQILVLAITIAISGLYSCCEISYFSVNRYKLKEDIKKGNKDAIRVNKLLSNYSRFLATIQVVVALTSFFLGAVAASYFVDRILVNFNISEDYYNLCSNVLTFFITIILSYFSLLFGELLPKRIGISNPDKIAYKTSKLIRFTLIIFYPFVLVLTKSVDFFAKIFNIKEQNEDKLTEEKIKKLITMGKNEGILENKETEILMNVFKFNDIEARKIMTPINDVKFLKIDSAKDELLNTIKTNKYTRFPILKKEKLIGVINVKDFIINYNNKNDLESLVREPNFINENMKIDDIFTFMKDNSLGLVFVGENEDIKGIVTMEDIIEEILGNIYDEYN